MTVMQQTSPLQITERAAAHVRSLLEKEQTAPAKYLRVYVESGGCSGMQYGLTFDEKRDGDLVSQCHSVEVLTDPVSAGHLQGSIVDYSDDLNSSGFKIQNPKAQNTCGCGKSFQS